VTDCTKAIKRPASNMRKKTNAIEISDIECTEVSLTNIHRRDNENISEPEGNRWFDQSFERIS